MPICTCPEWWFPEETRKYNRATPHCPGLFHHHQDCETVKFPHRFNRDSKDFEEQLWLP